VIVFCYKLAESESRHVTEQVTVALNFFYRFCCWWCLDD